MSDVKIVTNNHERKVYYLFELSEHEQTIVKREFDWIDSNDIANWEEEQFFNYRDTWYCLSDFMSLHNKVYCSNPPDFMQGWDGYLTDSFFSGILIKYPCDHDSEYIIVATFYS